MQCSTYSIKITKSNWNYYYLASKRLFIALFNKTTFLRKPFSGFLEPLNFFSTQARKLMFLEKMWFYGQKDPTKKCFRIAGTLFVYSPLKNFLDTLWFYLKMPLPHNLECIFVNTFWFGVWKITRSKVVHKNVRKIVSGDLWGHT